MKLGKISLLFGVAVSALVMLGAAEPPEQTAGVLVKLARGEPIPDITVSSLISPEHYRALGLEQKEGPVRIADIKGEMLVLEFFNRYCFSCRTQAQELERFYETIPGSELEGKLSVLTVGIGNDTGVLVPFAEEFGTTYPIAPDPRFEVYYSMGDLDGTPYSLFLRKKDGLWVVADAHLGSQGAIELAARARVLLSGKQGPMSSFAGPIGGHSGQELTQIPEDELRQYAAIALERVAGEAASPKRVDTAAMDVFKAEGQNLYAVVSQRKPICDLCHTIFFVLVMDENGEIKGFTPIYVTKFGNEVWSEEDSEFMQNRLVGRPTRDLVFNGEVDAVTSATMSSTLIFDTARRAGTLVRALAR